MYSHSQGSRSVKTGQNSENIVKNFLITHNIVYRKNVNINHIIPDFIINHNGKCIALEVKSKQSTGTDGEKLACIPVRYMKLDKSRHFDYFITIWDLLYDESIPYDTQKETLKHNVKYISSQQSIKQAKEYYFVVKNLSPICSKIKEINMSELNQLLKYLTLPQRTRTKYNPNNNYQRHLTLGTKN